MLDGRCNGIHISPGKALCWFCGVQVSMNQLSAHIAKEHPRPSPGDMTPTLIRKRKRLDRASGVSGFRDGPA